MSEDLKQLNDQDLEFDSLDPADQIASLRKSNLELKSQLSLLSSQLDTLLKGSAPVKDASEVKTLPKESFEVNGEKFKFRVPVATLPGSIGKRTAMEILTDNESYPDLNGQTIKEWLVNNNSKMVQRVED
jgi:hypothetical protein